MSMEHWQGRYYEDLQVGEIYRSRMGRTITDTDNVWLSTITMNMNQIHFNQPYAEGTEFGRPLVVSILSLAIVMGLSVADTSENALANLGWKEVKLTKPVFVGDTLWAESEVTAKRESRSRPSVGIVWVRTRGVNQRREVVIEFARSFMIFKRDAPEIANVFPVVEAEWTV